MLQISTLKLLLAGATTILLSLLAIITTQYARPSPQVIGSVVVGNEMVATTTSAYTPMPALKNLTATSTTDTSSHSGAFGSFIQTAAGTIGGNIDVYDATTTDITKRNPAMGTSTILIASLPANVAVGTYTYDVMFRFGLQVIQNNAGTTTLTYRIDR